MPTYQYACTECGHTLEAVQSFSDGPLTECPNCGGRLRKVFSAVGVVFKGSGFYRTDSRSAATSSADSSSAPSNSPDGKSGESAKSGGDSGTKSADTSSSSTGSSSTGSTSSSSGGKSTGSGSGGSGKVAASA